jgi:hypothetical protein
LFIFKVKLKNLGGYLLKVYLKYDLPVISYQNGTNIYSPTVEQATAPLGQDITLKIPNTIDITGSSGVYLKAEAILGIVILEVRITYFPLCLHVWGTTLIPFFAAVPCWNNV